MDWNERMLADFVQFLPAYDLVSVEVSCTGYRLVFRRLLDELTVVTCVL